jgi:hypothetical protein
MCLRPNADAPTSQSSLLLLGLHCIGESTDEVELPGGRGRQALNRRDGWREFGLFFSALADERRGHRTWGAGDPPLSSVDDRLLERIKDAEAPFWAHVRDALAVRHQ